MGMPAHVAAALVSGTKPEPDAYEEVSVVFMDVVGYTDLSSRIDSACVSAMLERLFGAFDAAAAELGGAHRAALHSV